MSYRPNRQNRKQRFERSALPVGPPATRISRSTYGFRSAHERYRAMDTLKTLRGAGIDVSLVDYRDTKSDFAVQAIFWLTGVAGGCRLNSRGQFVSSITGQTVASLIG